MRAEATLSGSAAVDLGMCFVSGFFGPFLFWIPASTEILAAAVGRQGMPPVAVGLACASGQALVFTLTFFFGRQAASRWRWLRRKLASVPAAGGARARLCVG